MSGDLPFGFGVPDEGGPSGPQQPFDMSQLGAMLQDLGRMMQSGAGSQGPVNWQMCKDAARQALAASPDPSVSSSEQRSVDQAVSLAQVWLDPACTFPASAPDGRAWSRAEWLEGTFPAWQRIVTPIAEQVSAAMQPSQGDASDALTAMLPEGLPPEAAGMIGPLMAMARQMGSALFGLFVGAVPGLTATMATALLVPVTFFMPPAPQTAAQK